MKPALLSLALLGLMATARDGLAAPSRAHERARRRFDEGLVLVDRGDLAGALAAFQDAYALEPSAAVLYNIAQALRALDRLPEAIEALERYRELAGPQLTPERRSAVDRQLGDLRAAVASRAAKPAVPAPPAEPPTGALQLRCLAAGTRVFADGRWLGEGPFEGRLTLVEGLHEVRFEHRHRPVEVRSVRIVRDRSEDAACSLPLPGPPPPPIAVAAQPAAAAQRSPGPWLTLAGGGALLGGALGLQIWNDQRHGRWQQERADLEAQPPPGSAAEAAALDDKRRQNNGRLDDIQRTDKVVAGVAVVGGLLVSAAVVWWWNRSHDLK